MSEASRPSGAAPAAPPPLETGEGSDVAFTLSGADRRVLAVLAGVILVLAALSLAWPRLVRPAGVEIARLPANELALRIDINTATWIEWMQKEGIGETMARNIVADREAHGPFRSIDDVARVRGIGDAILTRIRPRLQCRDCSVGGGKKD